MKSPYPYFGGKSTIADKVWQRLGDTPNFVDPFFGSNAFLLCRPHWDVEKAMWTDSRKRIETINDKDAYVANFWRALNAEPDEVARWADWPVNEADLHARHWWLVKQSDFQERMHTDPDYYDCKIAGWWVWGICQWIGSGWCYYPEWQQRPHLGDAGMGMHRPSQQRPHLGNAGRGMHRSSENDIYAYFTFLSTRLRKVRVCCGDWTRVLGATPTEKNGLTAIVLDPPYSAEAGRDGDLYAQDDLNVAHDVRDWAIANGNNPLLRIALFGYEDEHAAKMPSDWECLPWKTGGGYSTQNSNGNDNKYKERVWFSPHCIKTSKYTQIELFALGGNE